MIVPESTFYPYAKHTAQNMVAHMHAIQAFASQDHTQFKQLPLYNAFSTNQRITCPIGLEILAFGKKMSSKVLSAIWKWKETIPEVNEVNTLFGLKEVSLSNLSKVRQRSFEEYVAKRPRDNFSWCSTCL